MASISRGPNGRRVIQFAAPDGKRKTLRLGKCSQKAADAIKTRMEAIVSAAFARVSVDDETAKWLRDIGDDLAAKLAAVGLIEPRHAALALKPFLDDYLGGRGDLKAGTLTAAWVDAASLLTFFGPGRMLRDISVGDVDDFIVWLRQRKLSPAT